MVKGLRLKVEGERENDQVENHVPLFILAGPYTLRLTPYSYYKCASI